jgi:sulfatase modifying factor 1
MVRLLVALFILGGSAAIAWLVGGSRREVVYPEDKLGDEEYSLGTFDSAAAAVTTDPSEPVNSGPPILPEPHPWSSSLCPPDMVWVGGEYCPKVNGVPEASSCRGAERTIGVCMDPFEYPNQLGVFPAVMIDYDTASAACAAEGKRLCSESEWTFACQRQRPVADCNIGRTDLVVRTNELAKADRISHEIAANEGRRPNSETACVNDFRVFDLLGNVQEWVKSEHSRAFVGALKGGRYNQGSIGCTRSIYVSDAWTRYPHTGARCCADPLAPVPTTSQ